MPDPVFGERVCAVVELHPGPRRSTLAELVAHLRAQGVSVESWPERLLVLDELPRSSGGKIAKGELREEAARRLAARGEDMNDHITKYDRMPIPPVEAQTTWFDAGAVKIGVEYRLLNEAIARGERGSRPRRHRRERRGAAPSTLDDRGVSLHVFSAGRRAAASSCASTASTRIPTTTTSRGAR